MAATKPRQVRAKPHRKQRKARAQAAQANVRRVSEAGQDAVEEMASSSRHAAQQAVDSTSRLLETSTEPVRLAGQSTQTLGAMMQAGSTLATGMQSVWQEWMHYAQSAVETNVQGYSKVLRSATLPAAVAAQRELMQREMELLLASSRRISDLSAQCLNNAVKSVGSAGR